MSSARYSRVPTDENESVSIDFSSAFDYGTPVGSGEDRYKSYYKYGNWNPNMANRTDSRYEVGK